MIEKGDRVVLPAGFLQIAANPLKARGRLYPGGIEWFAKLVFGVDFASRNSKDNILELLDKQQESNEQFFINAEVLKDLDLNNPDHQLEMSKRLDEKGQSPEWWGLNAAVFSSIAIEAVKAEDAKTAAWATTCAERFRSMAIFKRDFEEVVQMGHSAGRLIELLRIWDGNRENGDEGFWQQILTDHSFAFSQIFSVPVSFIQGRAYVGGTQIDGKDARYLDFMLAGGSANHAILVEIKTPTAKLIGKKYRGNAYSPSSEITGAVVQVNDYVEVLRRNLQDITRVRGIEINAFNPRRIILVGNYQSQLSDVKLKSSFELFRNSLNGIEIVTFDEFFKKIEELAKLFNLKRTQN